MDIFPKEKVSVWQEIEYSKANNQVALMAQDLKTVFVRNYFFLYT